METLAKFEAGTTISTKDLKIFVNDIPLIDVFQNALKSGEVSTQLLNEAIAWAPMLAEKFPVHMLDVEGNQFTDRLYRYFVYIRGGHTILDTLTTSLILSGSTTFHREK